MDFPIFKDLFRVFPICGKPFTEIGPGSMSRFSLTTDYMDFFTKYLRFPLHSDKTSLTNFFLSNNKNL